MADSFIQLKDAADGKKEAFVKTSVATSDGRRIHTLQTATSSADAALIGALTETAPATDTASSGLNGRLQRIAQRITTAIASLATLLTSTDKVIPATTAEAVTPSDATALTSRAVWVGGAGDLSVRLSGATGTTVVFTAVPAGSLLPISVVRVMAATTATNINVLN